MIGFSRPKELSLVVVLVLAFLPASVLAEKGGRGKKGDRDCVASVRVIEGTQRSQQMRKMKLTTGPMLTDVKHQLQPLPYRNFRVLDRQEKSVRLGHLVKFRMRGLNNQQHLVSVKPHEIAGKKIHCTVGWKDAAGKELLSTKLRVLNGKTVVLGTENSGDRSTIIGVKLDCP